MVHNYFFVFFFVIVNMFLLNILIGFIIDNIVTYLTEDIMDEGVADNEASETERAMREKELEKGLFGKFYSLYTGTKKVTGGIKNLGIGLLKAVNTSN
jgi:hypothetical protein